MHVGNNRLSPKCILDLLVSKTLVTAIGFLIGHYCGRGDNQCLPFHDLRSSAVVTSSTATEAAAAAARIATTTTTVARVKALVRGVKAAATAANHAALSTAIAAVCATTSQLVPMRSPLYTTVLHGLTSDLDVGRGGDET